jgi:hypothetical protein
LNACGSPQKNSFPQSQFKVSYALRPKPKVDTVKQRQVVDSLHQRLEVAYEAKSIQLLEAFLQDWAVYSVKQTKKYPASDTVAQALSQVFTTMFSPFDFARFGWQPHKKETLFTDAKYLIIQGKLPYAIDFDKNIPWDTLRHFSPPVKYQGVTVLHYHEVYHQTFKQFFKSGDEQSKRQFLENMLVIPPWWSTHIISQPEIFAIRLNTRLNGAVVDYHLVSASMRSWLIKQNNMWQVVRSKMMAIE